MHPKKMPFRALKVKNKQKECSVQRLHSHLLSFPIQGQCTSVSMGFLLASPSQSTEVFLLLSELVSRLYEMLAFLNEVILTLFFFPTNLAFLPRKLLSTNLFCTGITYLLCVGCLKIRKISTLS